MSNELEHEQEAEELVVKYLTCNGFEYKNGHIVKNGFNLGNFKVTKNKLRYIEYMYRLDGSSTIGGIYPANYNYIEHTYDLFDPEFLPKMVERLRALVVINSMNKPEKNNVQQNHI